MKYELTKGHEPGGYTLGEGFTLTAKDNELTAAQAAPYVKAGILKQQGPTAVAKGSTTKKRGKG